jgi:hypothetical protein
MSLPNKAFKPTGHKQPWPALNLGVIISPLAEIKCFHATILASFRRFRVKTKYSLR